MPRVPHTQPHHSLEAVLKAVEQGHTVSASARLLGCTRDTLNRYRKRWKAVDEAIIAQRDVILDNAENALGLAVIKQEPWAVTFALRTLGRSRGYAERVEHEHTGKDGGDIGISVKHGVNSPEKAAAVLAILLDVGAIEAQPPSPDNTSA